MPRVYDKDNNLVKDYPYTPEGARAAQSHAKKIGGHVEHRVRPKTKPKQEEKPKPKKPKGRGEKIYLT